MAMTRPDGGDEALATLARRALVGRREQGLLDDPSVLAMALVLVRCCRGPEPWVRAAVATTDRFRREVAADDLPGLLAAGRADPAAAETSLRVLHVRHHGLAGGQLASLAFGPTLWWTAAGIRVPWRMPTAAPGSAPLPGRRTDPDVRLLLLAVIGTGATQEELLGVRVCEAGRLAPDGRLVPDLDAEPLAVVYRDRDDGKEHVTFLSYEARRALADQLSLRGELVPDEPLLLPPARAAVASARGSATSAALIGAGNDVNVAMCRATGDFFRTWGMPGARFVTRTTTSEEFA
ncbi:MAG: hypothetical protein JWN35_588 [Frankiales bacterium]|nr:hypothetical protein [Frankiales bacterium]